MNELEFAKSLASFGGVGILALVMWLSSKAATAERQALNAQFLVYMQQNAEGQRTLVIEVMATIHANTDAINRLTEANATEHRATLSALERLADRCGRTG